jgi:hypothetical protein
VETRLVAAAAARVFVVDQVGRAVVVGVGGGGAARRAVAADMRAGRPRLRQVAFICK